MSVIALVISGCAESTPYDEHDEAGYTVSVKYDANGGMFTTNVEVIVDSYDQSSLQSGEIALRAPDDESRGKGNYYTASRAGYFLAGWYTERTAVKDSAGRELDENGNIAAESGQPVAYTYAGRWDFENGRMKLDPNKTYSAKEPITLYAAWVKEFKYEFYSLKTGEKISEYTFDPNYVKEIALPYWNKDTGALETGNFPGEDNTVEGDAGSTINVDGIYLSMDKSERVSGETLKHGGSLDLSAAVADNNVMKVYIDYLEGEWYRIYTAKQFVDNSSVRGNYEIMEDLDFEGLNWKTSLMYGSFRGRIIGNGHVFKNIKLEQTDTSKQNAGLFGRLTSEASIDALTFKNVVFTLQSGTRVNDASFGLLCGTLDQGAALSGVKIESSKLLINGAAGGITGESCGIGLVCGSGWTDGIGVSYDGISYEAVGDSASDIVIVQEGNELVITPAP